MVGTQKFRSSIHLPGRGSENSGRVADLIHNVGEKWSQERKAILLYPTPRCQRDNASGEFVRWAYRRAHVSSMRLEHRRAGPSLTLTSVPLLIHLVLLRGRERERMQDGDRLVLGPDYCTNQGWSCSCSLNWHLKLYGATLSCAAEALLSCKVYA